MGRLGKTIPGWERALRLIDCLTQRTESQGGSENCDGGAVREAAGAGSKGLCEPR